MSSSAPFADTSTPILELDRLSVEFDLPTGASLAAVSEASLSIAAGGRLGLVGESGCGKSTTILATMGLLPASATVSGRVLLRGEDIMAHGERSIRPHRWTDMAMVFQGAMNAFNPVWTVGRQIAEPLRRRRGVSGTEANTIGKDLLERVGVSADRWDRFPHELSGGQKQRAAIAMALACSPSVLLADEPTTALDVIVQAQVIDLIQDISERDQIALVLVSHDLPLVTSVCQDVAVMYAGRIVESGTASDIVASPAHPYTRMLFAATPGLDGKRPATIAGVPPRLDRPLSGCPFADRCDVALDICRTVLPPITQDAGHVVACHRPGARP